MPHRVSPTERIRADIDELFASDRPLPEILEDVARLGARLLLQTALEAEVTEFLGRERYARAAVTRMPGPARATATATDGQDHGRAGHPRRGRSCAAPTEAFASRLFGEGM